MRRMILSMLLASGFACSLVRGDESQNKPDDATLGAKPPAGAIVLLGEGSTEKWVKSGRQDARRTGNWRMGS